jgi:hypothetical protein
MRVSPYLRIVSLNGNMKMQYNIIMFIEKWGKRILIIKEYWKFIILNKKTPMDYYNSEFIYIDNEWIKWERGIDNWLMEIRARARQGIFDFIY